MGGKASKWFQEHETMCIKIIRWIVFGVVASILPFWFMLSRYSLSGLVAAELDYLLDLLLISIAVSANAVNLLWDNEKKISAILKIFSIVILIIAMFYCAYTYGVLFEQTIWNNKMLEEYNKLTVSLEEASVSFTNNSDYENIMQRLTNIKAIIDEVGPKPDKLKHLRYLSTAALIVTAALGVIVEYIDDRNQRKKGIGSKGAHKPNPPESDLPQNPPIIKDGE